MRIKLDARKKNERKNLFFGKEKKEKRGMRRKK
jgi:hypothetical protein